MKGATLRLRQIVCGASLLLGAAQAMPLDYGTRQQGQIAQSAAPTFRVVSDHIFTPPPLPATVQLDQSVLDLPAGVCTGFHLHGGPGIETVLGGEIMVESRGVAPDQTFKAGEAYVYPAGVVHNVCNMTALPATFTSAFLLLDGAALVTPISENKGTGSGTALGTASQQTLEDEMQRFAFLNGSEDTYQAVHGQLLQALAGHGFRPSLNRHVLEDGKQISYAAWYQPALDMTVLCTSWQTGEGHAQTVNMMRGKLSAHEFIPVF